MDFDPTQIPMLHENPMYHMEQNQRFQHICDIAVQATNVEKLVSSYILTGEHLCTLLKDIISASSEMEFVCTSQSFGEVLQSLDEFQESFKNHFKDVQSFCLVKLKNMIKKDFPELVESKKIYTKNLEKYYQVQDHYLSLPKKAKSKINKERQNEFRKAFTDSATSFFEYIIKLDTLETKISNLFGTFLAHYPKSFLEATQPALEKEIKLTEKVDSLCPDYKSIEKRLHLCKQDFLSSIPQYFAKINSHFNSSDENINTNQALNSAENQSTASSLGGDTKNSSSQTLLEEQANNKNGSSNQIFSISGVGNTTNNNGEILEKQGYMWKRCGKVTKTWERKYFVCNQGVLSYSLSVETATNPSNTIQLVFSSVQPNESEDRPYVFNLVTQSKIYTFQAPSQLDFDEWVNAIQNGIAVGLSTYGNDNNGSNEVAPTNNDIIINNDNFQNNNEIDYNKNTLQSETNKSGNVSGTNSSDIPQIRSNSYPHAKNIYFDNTFENNNNGSISSPFPSMKSNTLTQEHSVSLSSVHQDTPQNLNHSSEFNFLAFSNVRRGSTINKKGSPNINLASASDSIPKIPTTSTPPSSPNLSFTLSSCADCGANRANWCIINRGLVVCDNCSGIHRSIPKVSTVRSLKLDKIDKYNMKILNLLSNNLMNTFIEATLLQSESSNDDNEIKRINSSSSPEERADFIKKKYIEKAFIDPSFVLLANKERQKNKEHSKHREHSKDEKKMKELLEEKSSSKKEEKSSSNEALKEKDKTKSKNKDKNKTKSKDKDDEKSDATDLTEKKQKDRKSKQNKSTTDDKESEPSNYLIKKHESDFPSLNVNSDLHADDDDVESLEARKHQGKRHHGKTTAARRRSFTTAQNQLAATDQSTTHQRHVSDCNINQQGDAIKETKEAVSSKKVSESKSGIVYHDIFEAIKTQDLFELMKIAFVGGLQEASLKGGFRPIHAASCIGNPILIVAIIENDPESINHIDDKKWSALSYASYHNNEKVIDALLAYGANMIFDPSDTENLSSNPLIIARELHHENIVKKLQLHFQVELPSSDLNVDRIIPLNTDFVPQEIHQSMVINDDVNTANQQSIKPMTDSDMSQIQQALKNMSKRPRMRRKSVTDAHKAINNSDEY